MARGSSSSPDENLAVEQYPQLNREFYSAEPRRYFTSRFNLLMLAAGKPDALDQLMADGVTYGDLVAKVELSEPTDEEQRHHQAFLTTEVEVLLHHASEALLRLYFAHAESQPCPWLECARLRDFSKFNARVDKLRSEPIPTEHIARVFLGTVPKEPREDFNAGLINLDRFLRVVADRVLDDKNLYNAAKHGLAVLAGPSSISLTDDQTGASFGFEGQSISYLELHTADDKKKTWRHTTRWLSFEDSLWLTRLVLSEMDSLWTIARARYIGAEIKGVQVITAEALDQLGRHATRGRASVTRSSFSLDYYAAQ